MRFAREALSARAWSSRASERGLAAEGRARAAQPHLRTLPPAASPSPIAPGRRCRARQGDQPAANHTSGDYSTFPHDSCQPDCAAAWQHPAMGSADHIDRPQVGGSTCARVADDAVAAAASTPASSRATALGRRSHSLGSVNRNWLDQRCQPRAPTTPDCVFALGVAGFTPKKPFR
jgi:hypothetical protein